MPVATDPDAGPVEAVIHACFHPDGTVADPVLLGKVLNVLDDDGLTRAEKRTKIGGLR